MPLDSNALSKSIIAGFALSETDALAILRSEMPEFLPVFAAAARVRAKYHGKTVQVQVLSNAKSGNCSEDCHYCSQSRLSVAPIEKHAMKGADALLSDAREAKRLRARRFCMGVSGRTIRDADVDVLCNVIHTIKSDLGLSVCCSLGFLTQAQAQRLKEAGLDRINHNLNTSERYYPSICTTHTFAERMRNLELCRATGLELCSGGIIGQGETDEDIVSMLAALRTVQPEAVPINFLIPVPGTPFAQAETGLTPMRCLQVLTVARLMHPQADIRMAGGREIHLRSLQPMALFVANSLFVNGYLTEEGQPRDEALAMIADLGFELEVEGGATEPV